MNVKFTTLFKSNQCVKISTALLCLFFVGTTSLFAQAPLTITGQIIESKSKQPLEFVTVLIADKTTRKPITGATTLGNGRFNFTTKRRDNFYVEVSFIGFTTKTIESFEIANNKIDLGTITLEEDSKALEELVVTGEKSSTEFKLDKRVFNVGKDLSNTGASALEVLNNVPSVNVNIEGQISLRGSQGVQILINGKPSILASDGGNALGTITADMIEKVEVITNPSAKYDAEGTSGIINIVLKKEEKKGLNGSVSLNTGTPDSHSVGISLNKRTEKFNLFSQFGVGYRSLPNEQETLNQDLVNNTSVSAIGTNERNETFYNVILGTDYHINDHNVITLSGNYALEKESQPSRNTFVYTENDVVTSSWLREETTSATNPKWQYELQYKKDFKRHKEQDLLISALGNFFGKDLSSVFENTTLSGAEENSLQQTRTDFQEARYTFKVDYTHPFLDKYVFETGGQYVMQNVTNDYAVDDWTDGQWVNDANLTNIFDYNQDVLGVYSTIGYEGEKWGIKGGVRLEHTDLRTLLETTNERNNQRYTNLFPSFHSSYKFSKKFSVQGGYSRRIYRPRLWSLNPFFNIRNNFSIFTGNPNLLPEFTDSYEINTIHDFKDVSFNFGVYYRHTTDVVERVTTYEDGVSISSPINAGINNTTGVEFSSKIEPSDWLSFNTDFNLNYFQREGSYEGTSFDFTGNRWSARATAKLKLPADIDLEVTGRYRSKFKTIQGEEFSNTFMNLGARKKIMKGKLVASLSVRDVFASRRNLSIFSQPDFYLSNRRQRGRFIRFGLSWGFGKGEAMQYSGGRRR